MTVLLITQGAGDLHAPPARRHLDNVGANWFELKLGRPSDAYDIKGTLLNPIICTDEGEFSIETTRDACVIVLRFAVNQPPAVRSEAGDFATREWDTLFNSAMALWETHAGHPWLIGRRNFELIDRKPYLLSVADLMGGHVPHTILTSRWPQLDDPADWVAKSLNAWQEVSANKFFNTRRVSDFADNLTVGDRLEGPFLLQRFVPHSVELRLYIAASRTIAIQIASQNPNIVDFRTVPLGQLQVSRIDPPYSIERICREITAQLGLRYCSFDVAQNRAGEWTIFDVNPLGSWDYLEHLHRVTITSDILDGARDL